MLGATVNSGSGDVEPIENPNKEDDEEEPSDDLKPDLDAANKFTQGSSHVPAFIKTITSTLPPKWVNWTVRFFTTIFLISTFSFLVYLGPLALALLVRCHNMLPLLPMINLFGQFGDRALVKQMYYSQQLLCRPEQLSLTPPIFHG